MTTSEGYAADGLVTDSLGWRQGSSLLARFGQSLWAGDRTAPGRSPRRRSGEGTEQGEGLSPSALGLRLLVDERREAFEESLQPEAVGVVGVVCAALCCAGTPNPTGTPNSR